ncbi:unnamed protein product [Adineta steineri]|uniref:Uncharacterized protein n=1 Tax=Adineta steineri TaxID=433720 RepID=A0A819VYS1_9BILA|nr:unnamed protein product [Adineta steineri]CAF1081845.1 unnamed protein product [Adineta steineri]CAF1175360.1 unnamed protein product [Adineta steineri]CAF1291475.1 unnamed protein product [Adineta steineri]CAF3693713.1 unnamed protein product [Adineta steineri]
MGCGAGRPYTKKDIEIYLNKNQLRLPSAELVEGGTIKLKTNDGFFNSSTLLDSKWLQNKMTNSEYHQAIEHINQRVAHAVLGTSTTLPINQIPKSQTALLAVEELNDKYKGRVHFLFQHTEQENSINATESFLYINFK